MVTRFKFLFADDHGLYGVKDTGELLWWSTNSADIATMHSDNGQVIGQGWADFVHVFAGGLAPDSSGCIIYAIKPNGELYYYLDKGPCVGGSAGNWGNGGNGVLIGSGWDSFAFVMSDLNGAIYGVNQQGGLQYYRHTSRGPTAQWGNNGASQTIATGLSQYTSVVCNTQITSAAAFYLRGNDGKLYSRRHADGTTLEDWSALDAGHLCTATIPVGPDSINNAMPVLHGDGSGPEWGQFSHLFAGGSGRFYAVRIEEFGHRIYWLKLDPSTSNTRFSMFNGSFASVEGFQIIPIEGYAWPMSAAPGQQLHFCISAALPVSSPISFAKLSGLPLRPRTAERGYHLNSVTLPAGCPSQISLGHQHSLSTSWSAGCKWSPSLTITIPAGWTSGFYVARVTARTGYSYEIPFIVKADPTTVGNGDYSNAIAVIANVNNWNAYNTWGGYSNYNDRTIPGQDGTDRVLSYMRPHPHLLTQFEDHGLGTHMLRGEIWVLEWLQTTYGADKVHLYTDLDLHASSFLKKYKCVVLDTHPEYWTSGAITSLNAYLNDKGKILYLGGNAMYRPTTVIDTVSGNPTNNISGNPTTDNIGMLTSNTAWTIDNTPMLGISVGSAPNAGGFETKPYTVLVDDPIFMSNQTKITTFGKTGWNTLLTSNGQAFDYTEGAAAGWEVERCNSPLAGGQTILANANFTDGNEGEMARYVAPSPAIGWAVGIASITVGGSLPVDSDLQTIVKNIISAAVIS